MNNIVSIPIFGILVISTLLTYSFQNNTQIVSATIDNPKDQLLPFDTKEMFESKQVQNESAENSSSIVPGENQDRPLNCEMPPCPPGQACIQSCP